MAMVEWNFDAAKIQKAVMAKAADYLIKKVQNIRCPEHGQAARIVATGSNVKNLDFEVSGCCKKLIEEVNAKLEE